MDLKDIHLDMEKNQDDNFQKSRSVFFQNQKIPLRDKRIDTNVKLQVIEEEKHHLDDNDRLERLRKHVESKKYIKEQNFDEMDKQISQSKLKFSSYYILNKQDDKSAVFPSQTRAEISEPAKTLEQPLDSKGNLLKAEEKAPGQAGAAIKDSDKYAGKEKDYGLGDQPYHEWDNDTILKYFNNTSDKGYDDPTHAELQKKWGLNRITPKKSTPWILKFIINMFGGFQIFLWIGGILCVIVYIITEYVDYQTLALGILCFSVVIGTSLFQTYQEGKSDDVMAALKALTPDKVRALRNGHFIDVDSVNLVPGDIIEVKAGDKVPADLRVLESSKLKVNNASLTGENVDINLNPTTDSKTLYEAKNIARMGCNFTNGSGKCIVFSTGDHTFFGHIAKSTLNIKRPDSCLTKEIKRLVHIMGAIAITIGIIFLILALVRGYKAVDAVVFMIGIIVANVPEGLLPQMTVALTLTAKKMQKKDVVVTNLEIIETLGAVTVICSDKTGTLTCNRMTVSHLCYDLDLFGAGIKKIAIEEKGKKKKDDIDKPFDVESSSFKALLKVMALNTNAKFASDKDKEKPVLDRLVVNGDASEAALVKFSQSLRDIQEYRNQYKIIHEIPFNSTNKWMLKIVQSKEDPNENDGKYTYLLKGAPERVMNFCKYYLHKNQVYPLTPEKLVEFLKLNERLASEGERVLAFAHKIAERKYPNEYDYGEEGGPNAKFDFNDFVIVGLASLQDPPRPGVKESIAKCFQAGIRVFMVTGDQPATALSIAKQLGLVTYDENEDEEDNNKGIEIVPDQKLEMQNLNDHNGSGGPAYGKKDNDKEMQQIAVQEVPVIPKEKKTDGKQTSSKFSRSGQLKKGYKVVNGVDLLRYTQEDWDETLSYEEVVFARTMPQQKQDIVNELRKKDEIIAMTGDGVNDAPALKAAHVGIAMGSGASVAKEAGQLILLKDDFTNIVDGISEGRLIFENLKKCICYVLTSNIPELIPFLLFIIIQIPLSIETIMIILIDVGTDLAPAVSLAWEEEENETMKLPPRAMDEHLVGFKLMFVAYIINGIFMTFISYWAWAWVYYEYGFTISDLVGSGIGYRETWLNMKDEQREFFFNLCQNNKWYQINKVSIGKNCEQDFKEHMVELMAISQSAFLMTVVWCQIALIFLRKTQVESVLTLKRFLCNKPMFWALLIEIVIIIIVIYIPGLNHALLLTSVPPHLASTGLWGMGVFVIIEEVRKWLIRRSPRGCVSKWTKF